MARGGAFAVVPDLCTTSLWEEAAAPPPRPWALPSPMAHRRWAAFLRRVEWDHAAGAPGGSVELASATRTRVLRALAAVRRGVTSDLEGAAHRICEMCLLACRAQDEVLLSVADWLTAVRTGNAVPAARDDAVVGRWWA